MKWDKISVAEAESVPTKRGKSVQTPQEYIDLVEYLMTNVGEAASIPVDVTEKIATIRGILSRAFVRNCEQYGFTKANLTMKSKDAIKGQGGIIYVWVTKTPADRKPRAPRGSKKVKETADVG